LKLNLKGLVALLTVDSKELHSISDGACWRRARTSHHHHR